MKSLITSILFAGILVSCTSSNKTEGESHEPSKIQNSVEAKSAEASSQLIAIETDEALIATALMAAPEESRSECKVIGYNMAGEFVILKEGSNQFICLADDPKKEGFSAACYHKDLEPFMARGRELKAEGMSGQEIFDIREEEVKAGKIEMKPGLTLHIYHGEKSMYDPETAEVADAHYRYVVYMPWATSESTGLPEAPVAPNHPWIMNPGTHRAHIMLSPSK